MRVGYQASGSISCSSLVGYSSYLRIRSGRAVGRRKNVVLNKRPARVIGRVAPQQVYIAVGSPICGTVQKGRCNGLPVVSEAETQNKENYVKYPFVHCFIDCS